MAMDMDDLIQGSSPEIIKANTRTLIENNYGKSHSKKIAEHEAKRYLKHQSLSDADKAMTREQLYQQERARHMLRSDEYYKTRDRKHDIEREDDRIDTARDNWEFAPQPDQFGFDPYSVLTQQELQRGWKPW